ncbi:peptidase family M48-domain-containing protein [Mycena belliarum]|uniref:Peptidase family M48-domain-containing protein n=1 Tax=Mycena belliarum TaxID=1033014 RepID=A0AAD6UNJ0_9AGAR|nr:peptidase family M48-domain-containing protein [Mycena belliae]
MSWGPSDCSDIRPGPAIQILSPSRFSSQGPNRGNGRWHLLDRTSTTYLGVTVGALLGGYYVTHLEKVPETGRRRFMAVSVEQEDYIHKLMVEETLQDFRGRLLPSNHPLSQQVRRITRRIITSSNLGHLQGELAPEPVEMMDPFPAAIPRPQTLHPDREWVVLVINDRSLVNAFAAPGLVCVSTGIMPVARNEEGLAAIIGHEIGHVVMRHTSEHLSQAKLFLPIIGLLVMLGLGPFVSALMMRYFYVLPHSRALETEADLMGIKLMARACYDPGAAPRRGRVFEAFKRLEAVNTFKFLDTHPPTEERIAHLKTLLPASFEIYNSNPECSQLDEMRRRGHLSRVRMNIDC